MDEKQVSRFWHPRQWSVMTWLIFGLWLLFAVGQNVVIEPPVEPDPLPDYQGIFAPRVRHFGWPAWHTEQRGAYGKPWTRSSSPLLMVVNVFAIALVQWAIVAVGHTWFRQFSLRTLFLAMGVFAALLVVGRWALGSGDYRAALAYLYTIYFLPVLLWVASLVWKRFKVAGTLRVPSAGS